MLTWMVAGGDQAGAVMPLRNALRPHSWKPHSAGRGPTETRSSAPYRPGFQPRGVYWPRTDEFAQARKAKHAIRIERTKLERRLEKLIQLHFPPQASESKVTKRLSSDRNPAFSIWTWQN
ncbi:hypothetical protein EV363DRAFT_389387 [Boletus edulis]|nr:hypothetical protein EV363DRAFT_389387 [Boletus edulis]